MELVRGVPITDYCDERRLSIPERLELFVLVCRAVQHAHQKGIIHRDIKPSNVLVTEIDGVAVPKVIDFGVAKAIGGSLSSLTLCATFHQLVGTPLYMSPEQADGLGVDVDTRSDIYSLGVLLYELLTGTTPFDRESLRRAAFDEMRRMLREQEPPRPSTRLSSLGERLSRVSASRKSDPRRLDVQMRRELDWVVMKALEKDRRRRYVTANDLAADLMRYLTDQPVEACPPSAGYRLAKFARRHRYALSTGLIVTLTLVVGTLVSLRQAIRAVRAEQAAELRAVETRKVTEFLVNDVLGSAAPAEAMGNPVRISDLLASADSALVSRFEGEPRLEAAMRTALGRAHFALGRYPDAERQLRWAVALRERMLGPDHPETLESLALLVPVVNRLGYQNRSNQREALRLSGRSSEAHHRVYGSVHPATLIADTARGEALLRYGDDQAASELLARTLPILQRVVGADHSQTLWTMTLLGMARCNLGDLTAEKWLRTAHATLLERFGPGHPDTLKALHELAHVVKARGGVPQAADLFRKVAIGRKAYFGPLHLMPSAPMAMYIECLSELGDGPAIRVFCEGWMREIFALPVDADPFQRERRAIQLSKLAFWLTNLTGDLTLIDTDLALRAANEAASLGNHKLHSDLGRVAMTYFRLGDLAAAEETIRRAMEFHAGGEAFDLVALALIHDARGDPESARACFRRASDWCVEHEARPEGFATTYREAARRLGLDPEIPSFQD